MGSSHYPAEVTGQLLLRSCLPFPTGKRTLWERFEYTRVSRILTQMGLLILQQLQFPQLWVFYGTSHGHLWVWPEFPFGVVCLPVVIMQTVDIFLGFIGNFSKGIYFFVCEYDDWSEFLENYCGFQIPIEWVFLSYESCLESQTLCRLNLSGISVSRNCMNGVFFV